MGWVGHDLKTGEIICLGRWLVDFNFWVGLRWLGASQMYVGWCVLRWSGLDSVLFGLGHLLSWVRIGIRPLENWLGILHEVGLSETGQFFKSSIWPTQQINQQHILISLSISLSLSLSLSLSKISPSQWRSLRSDPPLSWFWTHHEGRFQNTYKFFQQSPNCFLFNLKSPSAIKLSLPLLSVQSNKQIDTFFPLTSKLCTLLLLGFADNF